MSLPLPGAPPSLRGEGVRRLPLLRLDGRWQMAIDEWLLERAVAGAGPAFRLYLWSRPTLSLGFHQKRLPPHWRAMAEAGEIDLVRRPSGGRAVLHTGDITYALVWPRATPRRSVAYGQACGWLLEAFRSLGEPLRFGTGTARTASGNCFALNTAADLVHGDDTKRIGSAQLWRSGCLLQHGSLQLAPPAELWRKVFRQDPPTLPPLGLKTEELIDLLSRSAEHRLRLRQHDDRSASPRWRDQPLSADEWTTISERLDRYRAAGRWPETIDQLPGEATVPPDSAEGDTSPERTMAWAT